MRRLFFPLIALAVHLTLISSVLAQESENCPGPDCQVPSKSANFDLDCLYENLAAPVPIRHCEIKSTFTKAVSLQGGEVADSTSTGSPIGFSIQCDGVPLFGISGVRYTSLLGTRVDSVAPVTQFPSFTLPRGALHTGQHVSRSSLEIVLGSTLYRLEGKCYIRNV